MRTGLSRHRFKRLGRCFAGMMPPSESPYELEVPRASLAQALKMLARAIGKCAGAYAPSRTPAVYFQDLFFTAQQSAEKQTKAVLPRGGLISPRLPALDPWLKL